jgi:hypothetical protein
MYESRTERLRELSRGAAPRIPQPEGIALPLHPLQIAAAEYATLAPRMILGDPPGTGKDLSAIAAFVATAERPILVTAPPILLCTWREHFERALPDRRLVEFQQVDDIRPPALVGADVVMLRHRQFTRAADRLAGIGFGGMLFDQCQMLACRWTQLAESARKMVQSLPADATVVASSSQATATPRGLASAVEMLGLLERHPRLAAVRASRSWSDIPEAIEILDELRADCLLARGMHAVVALLDDSEASCLAGRH